MSRQVTRLRDGWKFTRERRDDAFESSCDESGWETVRVPHDWAIAGPFDIENDIDRKVRKGQADLEENVQVTTGRTGGLPHIGEGWYRREVNIPAESQGKVFRLECDGIMSHSKVYCNGEFAGGWPYGYTSFALDITEFVKPGECNVIAVHVHNPTKAARWYPGAGIYRNVRLVELDPVHIDNWGVCVRTPSITDEEGEVVVKTTLKAVGEVKTVTLKTTIVDPSGNKVVEVESKEDVRGSTVAEHGLTVNSPQLWSLESPNQYKVVSEVFGDGQQVDALETRFGFRTLRFDPVHGMFLNDKPVKMNGVCQHHDLGPLGAAVNRAALKRQLALLKEMGCNAIRTSHNPPDPQLPELASEMGILILDEMYDEWKYPGQENGSHRDWDEWAEKDMRALVMRDRNEPSVIMWSIGNEIGEQWKDDGGDIAQVLIDVCKEEDPTRPTTAGLNRAVGAPNKVAERLDIPGWNYQPKDYVAARALYPEKPMYGSETASTVSSRAIYYFPAVDEVHLKRDTLQVNSYDMSYPGWATAPDIEFQAQDECGFIMGEFVWTGFDYLGEPTPYNEEWPARSSYFGILDLGGIPKDRFYLYQSQWSDKEVLHLLPHWTWPGHEGKPVPVHCYTNFKRVELFVNGKSMGKKSHYSKYKVLESNYRFVWNDVPYEAGELKVLAYDKDGQVIGEKKVLTAGEAKAVELVPDRKSMTADGDDMAFVTVKVVDDDGNICPQAHHLVSFKVDGPAEIVGLCNGDATSVESFKGSEMKVFSGMMIVYLRSLDGEKGDATLSAESDGLVSGSITFDCN